MASARGASLADLRAQNAGTVFDAIRATAPISRAQLARVVGLTRPTVSSALETLLEAGLVRPSAPIADRPHYGATYFEIAPTAAHLVAFDLDRRQFRAVLVDALGTQLAYVEAHRAMATPADLVAHVEQVCGQLCRQAGVDRSAVVLAVIGVPAAIDPRDGSLRLSAYRLLEGFALGPAVSAALGLPVLVDNDVNLAAVGEQAAGAARGVADFAYLTIGRNVGAGIMLRDQVVQGSHGAAGEIDAPVDDEEPPPGSPAADAFEELARTTIAHHATKTPRDHARSHASATGNSPAAPPISRDHARSHASAVSPGEFSPTAAGVFAAAARADPVAVAILAEQAARIADSIATLCRVLDLDLVVLGGGIGRRCGPILATVQNELTRRLAFPPQVRISELEQRPVLVGACTLGVREAIALVTPDRLGQVIRPATGRGQL